MGAPFRVFLFVCAGFWAVLVQSPAFAIPDESEVSLEVSREDRGRIGVGLNYPGVGLRALVGGACLLEARGQFERDAKALGARIYLYVFPVKELFPYVGGEGDYVMFQGGGLDADGMAGEVFVGVEYFIRKNVSLQFDFGPAYAGLSQDAVSVNEIRFAVNFGLTVYF